MFQYSAAYALAKHLGTSVVIDASALERDRLRTYQLSAFRIDPVFADFHRKDIARSIRHLLGSGQQYHESGMTFDPAVFSLRDGTVLKGWFQSWRYPAPAAEEIRSEFTLRSPLSASSAALASTINAEPHAVSIHVRRGDYLSPESSPIHGAMVLSYYQRAMAVVRGLLGYGPHYFLFSDDPVWVRENLAGLAACTVIEGQDKAPWEDLALMSQCRHHIIANSSFSWWGAWLNPRPDKWVIAPRQWFTAETLREKNICDLLPPEWIAV